MADQVVPIQDIASTGVIKDIPSISLPPNAYSDVQNVRFHAGAARKMEGEMKVPNSPTFTEIQYVAYWRAPLNEYYIVVERVNATESSVTAYLADFSDDFPQGNLVSSVDADWQHTLFNGGFNFVLNNGVDRPQYLSDGLMGDNMAPLPNWDSYLAQDNITTVIWDEFNNEINLGLAVPATGSTILYSVTPRDTSIGVLNAEVTGPTDANDPFSLKTDDVTGNSIITPGLRTELAAGALPGDTISISIRDDTVLQVRAGVVRAYGNLLIAGDLTEYDPDDDSIIRRLPGTIRTSDVSAPGQIPLNWNPFRNGANTADEFILSSTGVVQDMAELQGVMYVYTDVSIHGIQQTGNEVIPFQISTVTDSYGANSIGAVMEFDGRHLVVGSQDIYIFAGHPGSISSIADSRIRHYAYGTDSDIDVTDVRMVRNQKYDEIWLFTPDVSIDEMLVWNYRTQSWTIRKQSGVVSGTKGEVGPLFASTTEMFFGDAPGIYSKVGSPTTYESFVQRKRLGLTPEFDTETLGSTAMMMTGSTDLQISMTGTERPNDEGGLDNLVASNMFDFTANTDYKVDTRVHGRFVNYKISDNSAITDWNLTGYQLEIMKGGRR